MAASYLRESSQVNSQWTKMQMAKGKVKPPWRFYFKPNEIEELAASLMHSFKRLDCLAEEVVTALTKACTWP